jgi:hypothetical protein
MDLANINVESIIDEKVFANYYSDIHEDGDANKIRFSWELGDSFSTLTDLLNQAIINSKNIVVIGYTFPLYNRFIDLEYLKQSAIADKRIFIQDPNADDLKQNFIDYYKIDRLKEKVLSIKNCDSFYVPSDIFAIQDYRRPLTYA